MPRYVCLPHSEHVTVNDAKGGPTKVALATYEGGILWSLCFVRRLPDGEPLILDMRQVGLDSEDLNSLLWGVVLKPDLFSDIARRVDLVELAESQRDWMSLYEEKGES